MVKVISNIDDYNNLYFEVANHTETNVCEMVSAAVNVAVVYAQTMGIEPRHYDSGRVQYEIEDCPQRVATVFAAVEEVIGQIGEQYPGTIKMY